MNSSIYRIQDPEEKNNVKQIMKNMSQALVDNSQSLAKSHEILSKTNDPTKKQKISKVHGELNETTDSFRKRFARILSDMKYLADDPNDKRELEKIAEELENKPKNPTSDVKLAKDLEDLGKTCLDVPVQVLPRQPSVVNKVVKQPTPRREYPGLVEPVPVRLSNVPLTPSNKRVVPGSANSPLGGNLHNGKPIVRQPTATTAFTNRYSPLDPGTPTPGRRLEPSKSVNNLTPGARVIPTARGLTPSRSYNNLTPNKGSTYIKPQPSPQMAPGSYRLDDQKPVSAIPRISNVSQPPITTNLNMNKSPLRSNQPVKRYRRLENGELVEIGPNDPPLYQAASPITKPSNIFKTDQKPTPIVNPLILPVSSSPTIPKTSTYQGTPLKSSNRIIQPGSSISPQPRRYVNREPINPTTFRNSGGPVMSPSNFPNDKDLNLRPIPPPQQKYNKKRERLRSLSASRSPNRSTRVMPSPNIVNTNFNNDPIRMSNVPIEPVASHTTNPGDIKNTPISDNRFQPGLRNGEYVN